MGPLTAEQRDLCGDPGILRMAAWWAARYAQTTREDLAELRAVAYLAAVEAAGTYRPNPHVPFPSHAATRIRWALRDAAGAADAETVLPIVDRASREGVTDEQAEMLDRALATLTERERGVVIDRVVYDRTLLEVAKGLRVTKERARQVYDAALTKLRERIAV